MFSELDTMQVGLQRAILPPHEPLLCSLRNPSIGGQWVVSSFKRLGLIQGVITASGTYKSLQASGTDMASLMKKGHNMRDRLAELTDIDSASSVSSDPLQFRFDDVELAKDNTLSGKVSALWEQNYLNWLDIA